MIVRKVGLESERNFVCRQRWRSIVSIVTICAGCACFVLGCVSAMLMVGRD